MNKLTKQKKQFRSRSDALCTDVHVMHCTYNMHLQSKYLFNSQVA